MKFEEIKQKVETKCEEFYDENIKDGKWKTTVKKALPAAVALVSGYALKAYTDSQKFDYYENQLELKNDLLEDARYESTCKSIRISQLEDRIIEQNDYAAKVFSAGTREGSSTCARELNGRKQYLNSLRN